jgi:heat shock protein HslJ
LKDKGQAVGSDGCNNFFMTWTEEEGKLTFTPGGATLRLCPNGEAQALRMHRMLPSIDSWQIKDTTLELYSKGSVAAVFEAVDM